MPPTTRQRLEASFHQAAETGPETAAPQASVPAAAATTVAATAEVRSTEPAIKPAESAVVADAKDEAEAAAEGHQAGAEATRAAGGDEAPESTEDKAPSSPRDDPAFQSVIGRAAAVARQQGHNNPAQKKAAEAQAAAQPPANDVVAQAAGAQVGKMATQKPAAFNKETFKQQLRAQIKAISPKSFEALDSFKQQNRAGALKSGVVSQVAASKDEAQGPIQGATQEEPSTAGVQPKTVTPQPPTVPGAPPPGLGAAAAAPKPKTDAEVSLDSSVEEVEQQWQEANLTEEKLRKGNEPAFDQAIASKNQVVENAGTAPAAFREQEGGVLGQAKGEAVANAAQGTGGMYATRGEQFGKIAGQQDATRSADEQKRVDFANKIQSVYDNTKSQVETRLTQLDTDVDNTFDTGADAALKNFYNDVEAKKAAWRAEHPILSIAERLGWPVNLKRLYDQARDGYIRAMDAVIDRVAGVVETGLNDAKAKIDAGRRQVEKEVAALPANLKSVGEEAAGKIQSKFDALESQVANHQKQLVDSLAQKYVDRLKVVDDAIAKMKKSDRGWVGQAIDDAKGVLAIYEKIRAMLARFGEIVEAILDDPGTFLNNLIAGVKAGLSGFIGNILQHLKKGLMQWLFGAMASAGIEIPESFDLKGILKLVMQVMGLTYQNVRSRAVRIVGEPIVKGMETAVEIFIILRNEGVAGLWRWIKEKVGNLRTMVMDGIISWVKEKIVVAGITWVLGLLNPAGALIKIAMAIIKIVDFFLTRGAQIMALANAIMNSLSAIVSGSVGAMAGAIENALARAIPVTLGFLAGLAGIGGISEMIRGQIAKAQAPVNKAIDWVILKAVKLAKNLGKALGFGKKPGEEDLDGVKDQARAKVNQKLGGEFSLSTAQGAVAAVKAELRPQGLKNLEIGSENEEGERAIIAEASPKKRIAIIRGGTERISVGMSAKVTVATDAEMLLLSDKERGEFGHFSGRRGKAIGGTQEAMHLPQVTTKQPSSGLIIRPPAGSSTIEVVAWNTGTTVRSENISHAEHQFISWINGKLNQLEKDKQGSLIKGIDITVTEMPCVLGSVTGCAIDIKNLDERISAMSGARVKVHPPAKSNRADAAISRMVLERSGVL